MARKRRHIRVRKNLKGTGERPRLNVYRSLKHVYAQIINDDKGETLVSASTMEPDLRKTLSATGNKEAAAIAGEKLAERALEQGIKKVVFDRGGFLYHGRIKALAEKAREKGLEF